MALLKAVPRSTSSGQAGLPRVPVALFSVASVPGSVPSGVPAVILSWSAFPPAPRLAYLATMLKKAVAFSYSLVFGSVRTLYSSTEDALAEAQQTHGEAVDDALTVGPGLPVLVRAAEGDAVEDAFPVGLPEIEEGALGVQAAVLEGRLDAGRPAQRDDVKGLGAELLHERADAHDQGSGVPEMGLRVYASVRETRQLRRGEAVAVTVSARRASAARRITRLLQCSGSISDRKIGAIRSRVTLQMT